MVKRELLGLPGRNLWLAWMVLWHTQLFPEGKTSVCSSQKQRLFLTPALRPKIKCGCATTFAIISRTLLFCKFSTHLSVTPATRSLSNPHENHAGNKRSRDILLPVRSEFSALLHP